MITFQNFHVEIADGVEVDASVLSGRWSNALLGTSVRLGRGRGRRRGRGLFRGRGFFRGRGLFRGRDRIRIARIHFVDLRNVEVGEGGSLGEFDGIVGSGIGDDRVVPAFRAGKGVVVHDRAKVVGVTGVAPVKVGVLEVDVERASGHRAGVFVDLDVVVAVSPLMFVPESDRVHRLVERNVAVLAAGAQPQSLLGVMAAHVRSATARKDDLDLLRVPRVALRNLLEIDARLRGELLQLIVDRRHFSGIRLRLVKISDFPTVGTKNEEKLGKHNF